MKILEKLIQEMRVLFVLGLLLTSSVTCLCNSPQACIEATDNPQSTHPLDAEDPGYS